MYSSCEGISICPQQNTTWTVQSCRHLWNIRKLCSLVPWHRPVTCCTCISLNWTVYHFVCAALWTSVASTASIPSMDFLCDLWQNSGFADVRGIKSLWMTQKQLIQESFFACLLNSAVNLCWTKAADVSTAATAAAHLFFEEWRDARWSQLYWMTLTSTGVMQIYTSKWNTTKCLFWA